MALTIADIARGVADESTLIDSVSQMVTNILANQGVPQAEIDAIVAVIEANKVKLNADLVAGTPASSPPPTP